MAKSVTPQLADPHRYEDLRDAGMSKEKAARISNAQADPDRQPSVRGGRRPPYEDWTVEQLYRQARVLGIEGRSGMKKAELIRALRRR